MSDQPAWATAGDSSAVRESSSAASVSHNSASDPNMVLTGRLCAVMNVGLAFMVAATGALAVGSANSANDAGSIFVGIYMVGFAAILFVYEVLQLLGVDSLDTMYKKNFGFLYGPIGKSCYLLFIGVLSFGLNSPSWAIATAVVTIVWSLFQCGLSIVKPDWFEKKVKYDPHF